MTTYRHTVPISKLFMVESFKRTTYFTAAIAVFMAFSTLFIGSQVQAIARGYSTSDESLSPGMVAALSNSGDSEVERADQSSGKRVVGVVTTFDGSSVTLASGSSKVLVESEGDILAYVSDIGGEIKRGDLLAVSSFKGILMKSSGTGAVLGVALEDSSSVAEENVTNYAYKENGASKTTRIFKIKINLNKQSAATSAQVGPSALSKIGESITGKQVSDIRVLAALIIFVLVMIAEGGIIYGAVTSAITALGRNPLARKMIRREMTRVIIVAIGVLGIGLGAVYGVLWY